MTDRDQSRPRLGPRRLVLGGLLGILLGALAALWSGRYSLARHYLDDMFARQGIAARYALTGIGPARQSIEHIAIGDPAAPDLVADKVEIHVRWGWSGPKVDGIKAEGVRLAGRIAHGRLTLGTLDRLLPKGGTKPFALPDLVLDLRDARMRLDTPAGPVGLSLQGRGNLAGGFDGRLAAVASTLDAGGCRSTGANAFLAVSVQGGQPIVDGPLRAATVTCAGGASVTAPWIAIKARFAETLDRWAGAAGIASGPAAYGDAHAAGLRGRIDFTGDAKDTHGALSLEAGDAATSFATTPHAALSGNYRLSGRTALDARGRIALGSARLTSAVLAPLHAVMAGAQGTPLGPLALALDKAAARASRRFAADATILLSARGEGGTLILAALDARSESGAWVTLGSGDGAALGWGAQTGQRFDGRATLSGGGLPDIQILLHQPTFGSGITGEAHFAPYAAPGARLALAPLRFVASGKGATRFSTDMLLDGPLGDGRISGLRLPIAGQIGSDGRLLVGTHCLPLRFQSLNVAGLTLAPAAFTLCPTGAALLARTSKGRLDGGGSIAHPRVAGTLGGSPVTIAAQALRFDIGAQGFTTDALALRLSEGAAPTRLDIARLDGKMGAGGLGGTFNGAAGQIAAVPLLASQGAGDWRLANGALHLTGGLTLADAAPDARFQPLASHDLRLTLQQRTIRANATLTEPEGTRAITTVSLVHDLGTAQGNATLAVPGITFGPALQPEALTRLTLGVVANVKGTVAGEGRIAWGPKGVTSSGTFHSARLDLAAAFGPVAGLAGTVHFTDLLALETAPGQQATIAEINPGIAVTDGVVRYQLLAGNKVAIESGRWPLAGGTLTLDPALLDLGHPVARRLTFRVAGLDAGAFIERFKLKDIAATGTFDGVLPMVFDTSGGSIEGGHLTARPGGGRLAYVGQVSNEQLGTFGTLAFNALKAMRYDALAIDLDGPLDGEIVSRIRFTGVHEDVADGAKPSRLLQGLSHLPFKFNIVVRAPFRGLLNSATTFADPSGLLHGAPVQPQESGNEGQKP